VIGEARRRGIVRLAEIESGFLEHERLASADDGLDFKESPMHLVRDAEQARLQVHSIDKQGPWDTAGGGFFTAVLVAKAHTNG